MEDGMECNICYENKQEFFKCNRFTFIACARCLNNIILLIIVHVHSVEMNILNYYYYFNNNIYNYKFNHLIIYLNLV